MEEGLYSSNDTTSTNRTPYAGENETYLAKRCALVRGSFDFPETWRIRKTERTREWKSHFIVEVAREENGLFIESPNAWLYI